ncbi:MAG: SRPBCC family protein [Gemmatimonadota bacterium]
MIRHELHTDIEIDAAPRQVWDILTDFASYPEWNPFIRFVRGSPRVGERLKVGIQPPGARGMTFRPRVLVAEAGRELRWRGRLLLPGIFDGVHRFAIEPRTAANVLFRHSEAFSGILVPLSRASLDRDTKRGFEEMNLALKQRAEAAAATPDQ